MSTMDGWSRFSLNYLHFFANNSCQVNKFITEGDSTKLSAPTNVQAMCIRIPCAFKFQNIVPDQIPCKIHNTGIYGDTLCYSPLIIKPPLRLPGYNWQRKWWNSTNKWEWFMLYSSVSASQKILTGWIKWLN